MRILLCKGQFLGPISGADETLVTYAIQLLSAGHAVSVLLMYPSARDDQYYMRLTKAGVQVSAIASSPMRTSLGAGRRVVMELLRVLPSTQTLLRKSAQKVAAGTAGSYYKQCRDYLEQCRPDLVHVMTPDSSAMVMIRAAHAARIPVIYQELGTPYQPPHFESFYEHFTSVLPLCSEVAALSPRLAQECRDKLPHSNSLSVLPIMTDELLNGSSARNGSASDVTFGFAARIEHLKGAMVLVEAFGAAHRKFDGVQLKIAGDGSQKRRVAAQAAKLGVRHRCHFTGVYTQPKQKSAFMRSLDVFVLPSLTEGTPNCIVEAMAHGLPIVASAVGGIPDVVTKDNGILVPPGHTAALADAMLRLAEDRSLRARMGEAGFERYKKLFSPEAVLPVMLSAYKRVVAGNGSIHRAAPGHDEQAHPWTNI